MNRRAFTLTENLLALMGLLFIILFVASPAWLIRPCPAQSPPTPLFGNAYASWAEGSVWHERVRVKAFARDVPSLFELPDRRVICATQFCLICDPGFPAGGEGK